MIFKLRDNSLLRTAEMLLVIIITSGIAVKFLEIYSKSFGAFSLMAKQRFIDHPTIIFLVTPLLFCAVNLHLMLPVTVWARLKILLKL